MNSCFKIHAERAAALDSDAIYAQGSSPFLLGYCFPKRFREVLLITLV